MKVEPRQTLPIDARSVPVEAARPTNSRQATAFEAVLKSRKVELRRAQRSDLGELSSSAGIASELFGCTRSLEILEHVLQHFLSTLDAEPEIKQLAQDLIREEIHTRRDLDRQRSEVLI